MTCRQCVCLNTHISDTRYVWHLYNTVGLGGAGSIGGDFDEVKCRGVDIFPVRASPQSGLSGTERGGVRPSDLYRLLRVRRSPLPAAE